jgi:hypothetical protein
MGRENLIRCTVCAGPAVAERLRRDGSKQSLCSRHIWEDDGLRRVPKQLVPGNIENHSRNNIESRERVSVAHLDGWKRVVTAVKGLLAL